MRSVRVYISHRERAAQPHLADLALQVVLVRTRHRAMRLTTSAPLRRDSTAVSVRMCGYHRWWGDKVLQLVGAACFWSRKQDRNEIA